MDEQKTEGDESVKSILADVSNVQQTSTTTFDIEIHHKRRQKQGKLKPNP